LRLFNCTKETSRIIKGVRSFFLRTGKHRAVVGLSGGVDSAVVLSVLVKALGKKNVVGIVLPETASSNKEDVSDAVGFAKKLGVKHFIVEIAPVLTSLALPWKKTLLSEINLKARVRSTILYAYANSFDALVAGTGNRSEICLGYFTKFGDGACDFLPIGSIYKTEVNLLAKKMKVPEKILNKPPSAGLYEGQTDERELGASYAVIDKILFIKETSKTCAGAKKKLKKKGFCLELTESIFLRTNQTEHKRALPPVI
jgi:NAD+ synthase